MFFIRLTREMTPYGRTDNWNKIIMSFINETVTETVAQAMMLSVRFSIWLSDHSFINVLYDVVPHGCWKYWNTE